MEIIMVVRVGTQQEVDDDKSQKRGRLGNYQATGERRRHCDRKFPSRCDGRLESEVGTA